MSSTDLRSNPRNTRGKTRIQVDAPEGSRLDIISVNWCDKTTWYPKSTKVTDEVYTESSGTVFNPTTQRPYVDVTHGKLTGEHTLRSEYTPVVKVDDVVKTENSPGQTDNDYTIDYDTGVVTFNASQTGKTVKVTYYYVGSSEWIVAPDAEKMVRVTQVEVQFSENIILNDSVKFQLYVAGNPYGDPTIYQTMYDYINESSLAYPSIPQMGGSGWRGMSGPVRIFRWPYAERGTTDLKSSLGMEIRVCLENDAVFGGDFAVATFYGTSETE
jgi:hypothetical protein